MKSLLLLFTGFLLFFLAPTADAKNGFDLSNISIPAEDVLTGGPPKDAIPAIDEPKFLPIKNVDYLNDQDQVISFTGASTTRAYPLRILIWHEIVNDTVGDNHIAVTYCPLCGTAMIFDRQINGKQYNFGVSGLLYQSDVLLYDRQTESLWSQLAMEAVSGDMRGNELDWIASEQMTFGAWKERYPDGMVLSTDTGFTRKYNTSGPYDRYFASEKTMFPVKQVRSELKPKEWVYGVIIDDIAKAYSLSALEKKPRFTDKVGNTTLLINYVAEAQQLTVTREDKEVVPTVKVFWFAWQAFYPQTLL